MLNIDGGARRLATWFSDNVTFVTIVSAVAVAIFNMAFYLRIGFHFIGLADFANLIYSVILCLPAIVLWSLMALVLLNRRMPKWAILIAMGVSAIVLLLPFSSYFYSLPNYLPTICVLIGLSGTLVSFVALWVHHDQSKEPPVILILLSFIGSMWAAGMTAAELVLHEEDGFFISTKAGNIDHARMLRISSSGLLIQIDGNTSFVPMGEVKGFKWTGRPIKSFSMVDSP